MMLFCLDGTVQFVLLFCRLEAEAAVAGHHPPGIHDRWYGARIQSHGAAVCVASHHTACNFAGHVGECV